MTAKKKKLIIAISILLLGAAVLVSFIFFIIKSDNRFLELDGYIIEEGHYTYFITRGYDEAYSITSTSGDAIWSEEIEGKKTEQWIKEYAAELCKRYLLVNKMFDELELTLDDDDLSDIEESVYSEWQFNGRLAIYGPMGVDEDTFTDIVTMEKKVEKLAEYYKDDLSSMVTEDKIKTYLNENYVSFTYITVSYFDEEGESTIEDYNALCNQVRQGKSVDQLAQELETEENERIITSIDSESGRIDIAIPTSGSNFPLSFVSDMLSADIGDTIYFDDTANMTYNIAKRTDVLADDYYLDTYREEITDSLINQLLEEKLTQELDNHSININRWKINRFNVQELY